MSELREYFSEVKVTYCVPNQCLKIPLLLHVKNLHLKLQDLIVRDKHSKSYKKFISRRNRKRFMILIFTSYWNSYLFCLLGIELFELRIMYQVKGCQWSVFRTDPLYNLLILMLYIIQLPKTCLNKDYLSQKSGIITGRSKIFLKKLPFL